MARRMIPAKLEEQLQKFNSNISEDGKLYLDGIVDADGHQRFIEGDITFADISGITKTYAKWSLSGSHLMIVVAGDVANETQLANIELCKVNLPQWIKDKIYNTFANVVSIQNTAFWGDDWTSQQFNCTLRKNVDDSIGIVINASITLSADRHFRVEFDLLIDAEQAGE